MALVSGGVVVYSRVSVRTTFEYPSLQDHKAKTETHATAISNRLLGLGDVWMTGVRFHQDE